MMPDQLEKVIFFIRHTLPVDVYMLEKNLKIFLLNV